MLYVPGPIKAIICWLGVTRQVDSKVDHRQAPHLQELCGEGHPPLLKWLSLGACLPDVSQVNHPPAPGPCEPLREGVMSLLRPPSRHFANAL